MRHTLWVLLAGAALVGATSPLGADVWHFGLESSTPEADAVVESANEVELRFTQVPAEGSVSIRLVDASDEAIHSGAVVQSESDEQLFGISLHHPLAAGTYTVHWRGMGEDGHVVRNSFAFQVGE